MSRFCFHLFVDGFGGMGDALVCCHCGLDKYPEAMPTAAFVAELTGRVIATDDPRWPEMAKKANAAREARREAATDRA